MTTTRTLNDITIYWDNKTEPEGWAYRASDNQGLIQSGAIEDCGTMDEAIAEASWILGFKIDSDDFAVCKSEGWAHWTSDFMEND